VAPGGAHPLRAGAGALSIWDWDDTQPRKSMSNSLKADLPFLQKSPRQLCRNELPANTVRIISGGQVRILPNARCLWRRHRLTAQIRMSMTIPLRGRAHSAAAPMSLVLERQVISWPATRMMYREERSIKERSGLLEVRLSSAASIAMTSRRPSVGY
jgi:hypothetical protein